MPCDTPRRTGSSLRRLESNIRNLILQRQTASALRTAALAKGMQTMFQDCLAKVFLGETTLEEVYRATI